MEIIHRIPPGKLKSDSGENQICYPPEIPGYKFYQLKSFLNILNVTCGSSEKDDYGYHAYCEGYFN